MTNAGLYPLHHEKISDVGMNVSGLMEPGNLIRTAPLSWLGV